MAADKIRSAKVLGQEDFRNLPQITLSGKRDTLRETSTLRDKHYTKLTH